jgi:hypothetical protein
MLFRRWEMRRLFGISGKWLILIFVIACQLIALSADVCTGVEVEPVNINAKTPNLNIDPAKKIPLKVAVVVPDPMAYTIYYEISNYNSDMTGEYRKGGFPLEREMSKVCSETFSQVFNQVVIVRSLPQPKDYDAIVQVGIGKILQAGKVKSMFGKMQNDVTSEWSISVLDSQNIELFGKKGVSQARSFEWSAMSPAEAFSKEMGPIMSETLSELAKEWGLFLYSSDVLNKLAVKADKP